MADVLNAFTIPIANKPRPIPQHKRQEYRKRFGAEIAHWQREAGVETIMALAPIVDIPYATLTALIAGRDTADRVNVAMMTRLAGKLSCELVIRGTEGEEFYGATTTLEELLRIGIWPTLEPIR